MRAYLVVITLLLLIFGSIAGYQYLRFSAFADMDFKPPPITIAASIARSEQWDQYIDAVGTIKARRGVELSSESSGEITAIKFTSGDTVAQGQELVVLDDDLEQASRRSQIASLDLAKILYERDRKLVAQKSIPQSQYDRSRADLEQARAQLAETEARIRYKRIDAPFTGTVGIVHVDVGDYIAPGTLIASLQDLAELEIDFSVPAQIEPLIKAGQSIQVRVSGYADEVFHAVVVAKDARVDAGTRNIEVRASVDSGSRLLPGMFAQLRLERGVNRTVITVPETAVSYSLHGDTIYVVKPAEDGQGDIAESRLVTVGEVRDGRVAILSALDSGEQVVTAGQNKLYRGAAVVIDAAVQF